MKKINIIVAAFFGMSALLYSVDSEAQLLKKLMNSVKQTAQNRVNSKADQATNKAFDKADSALQNKSKNNAGGDSQIDTAGVGKVLNAFAKAAADNPNDTSAADVTMKALGLLTGGGGVSAADSAAAIKSYMTASGGSGVFYQYITTVTSKQNGTTKDTALHYLTNDGNGRSEMRINMPGALGNKMISIGHAGQPRYTIMLYPESKTYSLQVIDTSLINSAKETYKVVKIGNEKMQGFDCIHSKLTSSTNSRFLKSSTTFDVWTSTAVPGYQLIKKFMTIQNMQPDMIRALEQAGCGGFFVKINTIEKDYSLEMLLVKAENNNFPANFFKIPAGYNESKQNMIFHMIPAAKK